MKKLHTLTPSIKSLVPMIMLSTVPVEATVIVHETFDDYSGAEAWSFRYADPAIQNHRGSQDAYDLSYGAGELGPSPAGGAFLSYETDQVTWVAEEWYRYNPNDQDHYRFFTTDSYESPVGHFHRTVQLTVGEEYQVSLWRYIDIIQDNDYEYEGYFTVWEGEPDPYQPFQGATVPVASQQYIFNQEPTWQQVNLNFIASGTGLMTFMMGVYTPGEINVNDLSFNGTTTDMDSDFRTIDSELAASSDGWEFLPGNRGFASSTSRQIVGLDDFMITQITPIPEPSAAMLLGAASMFFLRRRRS